MFKTLIRAWVGQPDERVMLLHMSPELYSGLETLVFIANQRLKDLEREDEWETATMESVLQEAATEYIRKHLHVKSVPTLPKPEHGTGRVQRTPGR